MALGEIFLRTILFEIILASLVSEISVMTFQLISAKATISSETVAASLANRTMGAL